MTGECFEWWDRFFDASESIFDLERVTKDISSNKMRIMIFTNLITDFVYTNNSLMP